LTTFLNAYNTKVCPKRVSLTTTITCEQERNLHLTFKHMV